MFQNRLFLSILQSPQQILSVLIYYIESANSLIRFSLNQPSEIKFKVLSRLQVLCPS